MSLIKTFLTLVIGAGMLISSAACSEPETFDEVEDFLELYEIASYAPPFWMVVRDSGENLQECLNGQPKNTIGPERFCAHLFIYQKFAPTEFEKATVEFQQISLPKKWVRPIRMNSYHPDPVIQDQILKTVQALEGVANLEFNLQENLPIEDSDIVIYAWGNTANQLQDYGKSPLIFCQSQNCSPHVRTSWDGYKKPLNDILNKIEREIDPPGKWHENNEDLFKAQGLTGNYFKDIWFFKEGILFSPKNFYQVVGYLRTSESGEIDKAICKIWLGHPPAPFVINEDGSRELRPKSEGFSGHSEAYRRQMTTECILRSLGLTGALPDGLESSLAKNERPKDIGRYPDLTELDLKLVKRHYKKN